MKLPYIHRSLPIAALALGLALTGVGCAGETLPSRVAGSTGPSAPDGGNVPSSGVGPGAHQSRSDTSGPGPSGAGPAGSR